jgi:hypothetical protein
MSASDEITPKGVLTLLTLHSGSPCNVQVQVLSVEEGLAQGVHKKFTLIISDGVCLLGCGVAPPLFHLIEDGVCLLGCGVAPPLFHLIEGNAVTKHTIVTINQVVLSDISSCNKVIILDIVPVSQQEQVVGDPTFGINDKKHTMPPFIHCC